jgi:hypothetical protein
MKEIAPGTQLKEFYETCVDKLLRHEDVTTSSLDTSWLIDYIVSYLDDGGDQKLMKLLILKDDRLVSDTVVHEVDADTLLGWAQENQYRTIVRALKEKGRRMRTRTGAGTQINGAGTQNTGTITHSKTWTFSMERLQRGVELAMEVSNNLWTWTAKDIN